MRRRSHSRSHTDYISYEFTASAGFDYNYDPSRSRTPEPKLDPYSDNYSSSPLNSANNDSGSNGLIANRQIGEGSRTTTAFPEKPLAPSLPSPKYILESQKASRHIEDPSTSRKLLILDLNGTLVLRSPHVRREYRPRQRRHHMNADQPYHQPPQTQFDDPYADPSSIRPLRTVHGRPYLTSFREYIFHPHTRKWLDTMVWSSAQPHSVADMVENCFGDRKDELVAIWARDTLGLEEKDYHRKTQTTKDLAKPWAALPISPTADSSAAAESPQEHSAHTTLLLDDSPRKAHLQPWNHLCIREYVQELRNTDIACRIAEIAREHVEGANQDEDREKQTSHESEVDKAEPEGVSNTNEVEPNGGEGEITRQKKRKRPKKKKKAEPASTEDNDAATATYDQTLLAAIGVLDSIKHESNVAGWMQNGGLRSTSADDRVRETKKTDATTPGVLLSSTQTDGMANEDGHLKRRRVLGEQNTSSSPPGLNAAAGLASGHLVAGMRGLDTPANIGDSGQWYEDVSIMRCWVARGVQALENLGIEIVPGIVV